MRNGYRIEPTPASGTQQSVVRKPRARKRPKDAPTHVRSWPLRPDSAQCRVIRTRFFTGTRVYNAVLSEFLARSRAVKSDPAWETARQMPRRTSAERKASSAAFHSVEQAHGFTVDAAQSFASGLRKFWVREHLPAQETQNLGGRAFDAVKGWHLGRKGKPRFKPVSRGLHSLAAKDGNGALRPKVDAGGRLVGLQWGAGFVLPIAAPAPSGRRGKEQQAELAEIEALIAAGKVLSSRIVRTVIDGRDTYRMQMVMDGFPTPRHPVGDGRVSFDLGPSEIAVAVERSDGTWAGWVEPLADGIRLDTARLRRAQRHLDRQHRAGSPGCFGPDGTHKPGRCDWQRSRSAEHTKTRVAELHRRLAGHRKTLHGALANRLFAQGLISRARSWITSRGRRTSRAVCATGHRGCLWRRCAARLKAPAGNVSTSTTPRPPPCPKPACAGTARKSRSLNGSTAASAAYENIATCSPPTSDCTSEETGMVSIGWTCRKPNPAGCTVTISTDAEVHSRHHLTGEAADTRPRGGRWRA
jgi:putative transposase